MIVGCEQFDEVWACDFEYSAGSGERPEPLCMVARELGSGRLLRYWRDDLRRNNAAPFATGSTSLFVAYFASAELGCFLELGWAMPCHVLDLYVEFRKHTNGCPPTCGAGLLGAMAHFGFDCIESREKDSMRELALRGGEYSEKERVSLLDYCQCDVDALARLLPAMLPFLDLPRALIRGRYMASVATMEHYGVPIDITTFKSLARHGWTIRERLIERVDEQFQVYDGRTFKYDRFARYLAASGIAWPRLPSGRLALDDDTFRLMSGVHPQVAPLRELRLTLSRMRLVDLSVGRDGRNRCLLSPFRSITGRNQPSNSRFVFGPSVWLRSLIRPTSGYGLAYVDWGQQEFGIAAALSGDEAMLEAYRSGDPYLAFARQAGAVPSGATKESHGATRELFKACSLATQYGMGAEALAERINRSPAFARDLLYKHRQAYATFWRWSDAAVDAVMLNGSIHTVFGWTLHAGPRTNGRSVRNFPMQANGAEMLRLACISATPRVRVCAPIHDALLIEAPLTELDDAVRTTQTAMADASAAVLDGFRLRTDVSTVRFPERYRDERGQKMWNVVVQLLGELEADVCPDGTRTPVAGAAPCNLI